MTALLPVLASLGADAGLLTVRNATFAWNGRPAFLNGVNQAWLHYGSDFGNNQSHGLFCELKDTLRNVSLAGGHAMRIWLHTEGDSTPKWDAQGFVVGTDNASSLIDDMRGYLRAAAEVDVLVFFCLWNGAVLRNERTKALFSSPPRLRSYIDTVLTPMVTALKDEPALGGWEVVNEPEGSVAAGVADAERCFDTTALAGTGAGWAQPTAPIPMRQVLRFVAAHAAAIHAASPGSLVTVGSWSEHALSDELGLRDYYTSPCLQLALGEAGGDVSGAYLDFAQVHSYPTDHGEFNPTSPFRHAAAEYGLRRPIVVGEFATGKGTVGGVPAAAPALYGWTHTREYGGGWGWTAASDTSLFGGMATLKALPDVALIKLPHAQPPPLDTCRCSDVPPSSQYTCEQQASWGKCGEPFMRGFCCRSCHGCAASCTALPLAGQAEVMAEVAAPSASRRWYPDWPHEEYRSFVERARARARVRVPPWFEHQAGA